MTEVSAILCLVNLNLGVSLSSGLFGGRVPRSVCWLVKVTKVGWLLGLPPLRVEGIWGVRGIEEDTCDWLEMLLLSSFLCDVTNFKL